MKNILKLMLALSVVFGTVFCGGEDAPRVAEKIVAEWHLVSMSGVSSVPQVYVNFAQDLTFELYQKVGEGRYRKYDGTYTVTGNVVAGKYSDNKSWGSEYDASFDGENLVLTAKNGSAEVCTYKKEALSETDKANAILVTKSVEDGPRFF